MIRKITLLIAAGCFSFMSFSQTIDNQLKEAMVADWERAKEYTLEYINAMPEDKIGFKATEGVRSFAEQMLHLSQGTIGLSANGAGITPIYADQTLEKNEELKNKESLLKVVTEAYDFAIRAASEFDISTASEVVSRGPFNITRLDWLKKAFEHQTHHRGQCTIYLRLAGVTPPPEKLF